MEITLDYILFYFTGGHPTGRARSHVHRMHHANMAWIWVSADALLHHSHPQAAPPPHRGKTQALTWPPSPAHSPRCTFHLLGPGVPGKNIHAPVQCSTPLQTELLQMHLCLFCYGVSSWFHRLLETRVNEAALRLNVAGKPKTHADTCKHTKSRTGL